MRTMTIEELLVWAFVHELPKGGGVDGLDNPNSAWRMLQASSWGKITDWAELMATIDVSRGGADNFMIEQGAPHDDALALGEAVAELSGYDIIVPAGWSPLPDWPREDVMLASLADAAVARALERFKLRPARWQARHLMSLVIGTAVLGREPGWEAPVSSLRMVERAGRPAWFRRRDMTDAFGRQSTVEVDGYNPKAGRPHRGAYRKYELSDDPVGDILGRLDREIWAAALRTVAQIARPRLSAHRVLPVDIDPAPWGAVGPRIDLVAGAGKKAA